MSNSATSWNAPCQAPLSSTISWSLLKFMFIESVMLFNHLIIYHPLLLLPSIFPSIRIFSGELAFHIGRRKWQCTPIFLPGESQGQRSLVGCHLWGHTELDTTERLHFQFSLSCIGEGNGNPLQCSCLENPRDRGVWWAAIYGVAQGWDTTEVT